MRKKNYYYYYYCEDVPLTNEFIPYEYTLRIYLTNHKLCTGLTPLFMHYFPVISTRDLMNEYNKKQYPLPRKSLIFMNSEGLKSTSTHFIIQTKH